MNYEGELSPILNESSAYEYEDLVEDTPAHYVDAKYAEYGIYDYDTGISLPKGYKVISRYIKGKLLIVMKMGPYNSIPSTYDGRHGLCSSSEFRDYVNQLKRLYEDAYNKFTLNDKLSTRITNDVEKRILASYILTS